MPYAPSSEKLATCGFGPAETRRDYTPGQPHSSRTHYLPGRQFAIVVWPAIAETRFARCWPTRPGWDFLFTGTMSSEDEFDALLAEFQP